MIWLHPTVLFALVAVAAPILIHILVHRRAERFPFPTLRFVKPTRLSSIRRHVLDDVPLVAVRAAILAAAAGAFAGPLMVTSARRQAWDRRVVRAVVSEGVEQAGASDATRRFQSGGDLADAVRRAVAWLDTAPPARRELVIVSPLAIGSITAADIASVPDDVGIRFERSTALPSARTMPFGRILTKNGPVDREVTLAGSQTSVSTAAAPAEPNVWPIEVFASPEDRGAVDAARSAVLTERVWAPPADRLVRLFVAPRNVAGPDAQPVHMPWIADAIARIAHDADLQTAAARLPRGVTGASFTGPAWQTIAAAADGRPVAVAAAAGDRLLIASAAPASDVVTPLLMRSIVNALALAPEVRNAEVVPIADAVLTAWSRPSSAPAAPRIGSVDEDDRRWLWAIAVLLLAVETWIRRASRQPRAGEQEETTRVA